MSRLLVQLGKFGDIINLFPIALAESKAGKRIAIMTCLKYAPVFEGVSYVDHVPFAGELHELQRAVAEARKLSDDVVVTQVIGDTPTLNEIGQKERFADSFLKESWYLAGKLKEWQNQPPMLFDQRSPERELALIQSLNPLKAISRQRKYVLISAGGETSAFPFRDLLFELVRSRFCGGKAFKATIIDLVNLKAEKLYDLLGLYSRATCLIACDSAHLHLARACPNLPVCCLANDKPVYWSGSPWQKNFIFYSRYSDFPKRAVEMLDAIANLRKPGSILPTLVPGQKLIHAYSAYDLNGEHAAAKETWEREYMTGRWIATPIELGAIGRDSKTALKDDKRHPFLKDAIRLAGMRAKDDDLIVLTRSYTCFVEGLSERLTGSNPWFCHRRFLDPYTHHPSIDLFCFTKSWWKDHRDEVPDLLLGRDSYWDRVLMETLKRHGGKELPLAVYRNKK